MINASNGILTIDNGDQLTPFQFKKDYFSLSTWKQPKIIDRKSFWTTATVAVVLSGKKFVISPIFKEDKLQQIHLICVDTGSNVTGNGDEDKTKIMNERWLQEHLGNERNFRWGSVESKYDARAELGFIVIQYVAN